MEHRHSKPLTPCHSHWVRLYASALIAILMTGCLDFGEENEFFAPNVTAEHLQVIEKRTGIDLPQGSVGLALYSNATGIDPWMMAKIRIPSDKVEALLTSAPFKSPQPLTPTTVMGAVRPWWKPNELAKASSGEFNMKSDLVMWTLGLEGTDHVLYVQWFTF